MNRIIGWVVLGALSLAATGAGVKKAAKPTSWEGVKPVFVQSCFACHAPSLAPEPVPNKDQSKERQAVQRRAKGSFPMGEIFPFEKGPKPSKQVREIRDSVADGRMPHYKQNRLALGLPLSPDAKKAILEWCEGELLRLQTKP